ncbi:hypothetical protein WN51_06763 [Melipona quadrifasciata]|uniref:Transmembrane protein 186 n=1 Tax=Melipona quadrifasciata TaxID=166423 RepID=A0A0N0BCI0_9HYME|nr:hypothetical protein WN51_06763 [Melipona quadrifasciata]
MNLLIVHFRKQFRYCFYNSINNTSRQYNHGSNKEYNNASSLLQSKQFPDYTVLYVLPMITIPYVFNKMKRNYTFFVAATIPISVSLDILGLVPTMDNLAFMSCKNEKDKGNVENQKMIISYVNYWGQRIDLKTTVDDIIPFVENYANASNNFFKTLSIKSSKQTFKVYVKYGKITGPSFYNIFG